MDGKAAIAIAHQVNCIVPLDCIIILDQGQILEDGKHFELLERNGLYASFWSRVAGGHINT